MSISVCQFPYVNFSFSISVCQFQYVNFSMSIKENKFDLLKQTLNIDLLVSLLLRQTINVNALALSRCSKDTTMISKSFQRERFEVPAVLSFQTGRSRMYLTLTELKQLRRDCRIWLTAKQEKVWNLHVRQQSTRSLRQSNKLHEDTL